MLDECKPHIDPSTDATVDEPTIQAPNNFVNQAYTITEPSKTYTIPAFTTSPALCASRLEYEFTSSDPTIVGTQGPAAVFNAATKTFTFHYTGDTDLGGLTADGIDYELTVTAKIIDTSYS